MQLLYLKETSKNLFMIEFITKNKIHKIIPVVDAVS